MTKLNATSSIPPSGVLSGNIAEILPSQLYFASFSSPPTSDSNIRYVTLDDKVHYDPFYKDFGPLNLSVLYRFCNYLHSLVEARTRRKIVVYTSSVDTNRVNGAYVIASYLIIYHGVKADMAYLRVEAAQPPVFIGFRDAAMGSSTWNLHLHDVLRGLEKGLQHKWFEVNTFDADEYEFYEKVENGDFNWIIPSKILSFCGPHEKSVIENGYPYHAPEVYFDYFRAHGITTIVRLNMPMYDAKRFTDAGFNHVDLFFVDGSTPSDEIVRKFIKLVDKSKGGVAIHCKAGLGRTGTLIACWMMKEFGLTAPECISWLRICRPGSVIGPQQEYLLEKQQLCWQLGGHAPLLRHSPSVNVEKKLKLNKLVTRVDDISLRAERVRPVGLPLRRSVNEEECVDSLGRSQGDRLLQRKARGQLAQQLLAAHFTSPTTPIKPLYTPSSISSSPSRAARNLLHSGLSAPISRVTVTAAKPAASKATPPLKKIAIGYVLCPPMMESVEIELPSPPVSLWGPDGIACVFLRAPAPPLLPQAL